MREGEKMGGIQMKLRVGRTILIGVAFLSISAFWQMYDNIIPLILEQTFGLKETITGVIMAMDNVLALFLLPILGSLSDKVNTAWGKRTPFIVGGTILAILFMMMLPVSERVEDLTVFIVCLFGTLIAMGLYRSPAVALMPDLTPNKLRSKANAIINLMGAVGGLYALAMITVLIGNKKDPSYMPLFTSISAFMAVAVVILVFTINENKLKRQAIEEYGAKEMQAEEKDSADPAVKVPLKKEVKKSLTLLLFSVALWYMAYNAVTTAISRYALHLWGEKSGMYTYCTMLAMVVAIISYVPIGIVASKIGRKKTILSGVVLMTVCYAVAIMSTSFSYWLLIPFGFIGLGWAAINVNSYPMVVAMSRGSDIGKYTGLYYTFSMSAQVLTPILSGFLLEKVSYYTLFPYAVVFSILAFITMSQVKHGDEKAEKKDSLLEHFDVED